MYITALTFMYARWTIINTRSANIIVWGFAILVIVIIGNYICCSKIDKSRSDSGLNIVQLMTTAHTVQYVAKPYAVRTVCTKHCIWCNCTIKIHLVLKVHILDWRVSFQLLSCSITVDFHLSPLCPPRPPHPPTPPVHHPKVHLKCIL